MWAARKALLEQRLAFAPSVRSDLSYPPGYLHGTGFRETLWVGVNPNHGGPNRTARSIGKSAVTSVTSVTSVTTMLQSVSLSMPR